jgi:hypothetical protein
MTMMDALGERTQDEGSMLCSIDLSNPVIGAAAGDIFNSNLRSP